jgi:hypothetical protein
LTAQGAFLLTGLSRIAPRLAPSQSTTSRRLDCSGFAMLHALRAAKPGINQVLGETSMFKAVNSMLTGHYLFIIQQYCYLLVRQDFYCLEGKNRNNAHSRGFKPAAMGVNRGNGAKSQPPGIRLRQLQSIRLYVHTMHGMRFLEIHKRLIPFRNDAGHIIFGFFTAG